MAIQVSSGPGKVLDWGTVTLWGSRCVLNIRLIDFSVAVRFSFHSDGGDTEVQTRFEGAEIELECRNFDGDDGRGSARPVLIGEAGDDLFFLHFRVFRFGRTEDRTLHYTLYRVDKAAVGWTPKSG